MAALNRFRSPLVVGDVVRVQAGQAFPGDGEVLSESATVDEAC
jgi:P-type Cu2+ transporter